MKLTIESTDQIATIDGVACRLWEVVNPEAPAGSWCYVARIAIPENSPPALVEPFDRELKEVAMRQRRTEVMDLRSVL